MEKIVDIGGQAVRLRADGATPYRYKSVFGGDIIRMLASAGDRPDEEIEDMLLRLAYVMHLQAEGFEAAEHPGEDGFLLWLAGFDLAPSRQLWSEALSLWYGNAATSSEKKTQDEPSTGN